LCQARVIMMMEKLVEWLAGETEVLGENLPQCRFVHHKSHMPARTRTRAAAMGSHRLTAWRGLSKWYFPFGFPDQISVYISNSSYITRFMWFCNQSKMWRNMKWNEFVGLSWYLFWAAFFAKHNFGILFVFSFLNRYVTGRVCMYVCVIHASVKSCVGSELAMGRSPVQGVLQSV
jgi:hypothetical protein